MLVGPFYYRMFYVFNSFFFSLNIEILLSLTLGNKKYQSKSLCKQLREID